MREIWTARTGTALAMGAGIMMKSLLSVALLAASGCNLVHMSGLPGSSSSGSAPAASAAPVPAGAAGGQAAPPTDARADFVKMFQSIDYKSYDAAGWSNPGAAASIELGAVDNHGKKIYAVTPDRAWLPGWQPGNFSVRDLPVQVAQAGINRTWQAACFADYASFRAGWKVIDASLRPKLVAARAETSFYARTAALRDLYGAIGAAAAAAGVDAPAAHPAHWIGLRWEVAHELLATIASADRGYARRAILGPIAEDLAHLAAAGRALSPDDALERDAFCDAAVELGTQHTGKLPQPRSTGWELGPVTWPVSETRHREVTRALTPLLAADRPDLGEPKVESVTSLPEPITAPIVTLFDPSSDAYIIDSVTAQGAATRVHATAKTSAAVGYDCRTTSRVDHYTDGGQPIYATACKTGTRVDLTAVDVTFAELPAGMTLAKGGKLAFYGAVTAKTSGSKTERGGALQTVHRDLVVTGTYLLPTAAAK